MAIRSRRRKETATEVAVPTGAQAREGRSCEARHRWSGGQISAVGGSCRGVGGARGQSRRRPTWSWRAEASARQREGEERLHMTVSVMVPNEIIPDIAASAAAADRWVAENLVPYYPETRVKFLLVGNEVLSDQSIVTSAWPGLVPAMENLHRSLCKHHISSVKIGTTLAMHALADRVFPRPPSADAFRANIAASVVRPLLHFLNGTSSYYFVDAYPYFV